MKRKYMLTGMVAGIALLTSAWTATVGASDEFGTLSGIPAETISQSEMRAVEGKFLAALPLLKTSGGLNPSVNVNTNGIVKMPNAQQITVSTSLNSSTWQLVNPSTILSSLNLPLLSGLPVLSNLPILSGSGLPLSGLPNLTGITQIPNVSVTVPLPNPNTIVSSLNLPAGQLPIGQLPNPSAILGSLNLPIVSFK